MSASTRSKWGRTYSGRSLKTSNFAKQSPSAGSSLRILAWFVVSSSWSSTASVSIQSCTLLGKPLPQIRVKRPSTWCRRRNRTNIPVYTDRLGAILRHDYQGRSRTSQLAVAFEAGYELTSFPSPDRTCKLKSPESKFGSLSQRPPIAQLLVRIRLNLRADQSRSPAVC